MNSAEAARGDCSGRPPGDGSEGARSWEAAPRSDLFSPVTDGLGRVLDLTSIERSLRAVQADFSRVSDILGIAVDPLEDRVIRNVIHGYALVDGLIADGIDVLAPGYSPYLLELNARVLCGVDRRRRQELASHLAATRERFYGQRGGGIGALVEWSKRHDAEPVWDQAAGMFLVMVNAPQLFIEGNHRTGMLFMNYLLLSERVSPFVLCEENVIPFFAVTTAIARFREGGLTSLFALPRLRRALARLLREQTETGRRYLR